MEHTSTRFARNSRQLPVLGQALAWMLAAAGSASAQGLPTLADGKFFSSATSFSSAGWAYSGTLPQSFAAGFRARNDEDDCVFCERQYANGYRTMTTVVGPSPSYQLKIGGSFESEQFEGWSTSLLDQSRSHVWHGDVDRVRQVTPLGGLTQEAPINSAWQGTTGYANSPTAGFAAFSQTFTLTRPYLQPDEGNCPLFVSPGVRTGHCGFVDAMFFGGATLQAGLAGHASIANTWAGTQTVSLDAMSNRTTTFTVNGLPLVAGSVAGTAQSFNLIEEKVSAADFKFGFNFNTLQLDLGANVKWDGQGEASAFNASYNQRVQLGQFASVGRADTYAIQFRDEAQLMAGITGRGFNSADVEASAGVSSIDALLRAVYQPMASGHLKVVDASTYQIKSPNLLIPAGGFVQDLDVLLHFQVANDGSAPLTLDGLDLEMFDTDPFLDDFLGALRLVNLGVLIPVGSGYEFSAMIRLPHALLNAASDLLEGNYLELMGKGKFHFSDVFGQRDVDFTLAVPEPGSAGLVALALLGVIGARRSLARGRSGPPRA